MNGSPSALVLGGLVVLIAVLLVLLLRASRGAAPGDTPFYLDEGRGSRTFVSDRYRIRARPDKLEGSAAGATLVELKSRARGIHAPDRAQILATALAVRAGGVRVTGARLETLEGAPVELDLDASDEALFARIRPAVEAARLAVRGIEPAPAPSSGKCRACGYRARCPHRADGARAPS